eukprot:4694701-Amphidinium_carterae.1
MFRVARADKHLCSNHCISARNSIHHITLQCLLALSHHRAEAVQSGRQVAHHESGTNMRFREEARPSNRLCTTTFYCPKDIQTSAGQEQQTSIFLAFGSLSIELRKSLI